VQAKLSAARSSVELRPVKVLFVCAIDISAAKLLAAQVRALERAGFIVHVACMDGPYARAMAGEGYSVKAVPLTNRPDPISSLLAIGALYRLMRQERYDVVHVHMISAAFLGRIAAGLARIPLVFYTFRGFAFYANSRRRVKWLNLFIERCCSPFTDFYFSQSEENRRRAIRHGVLSPDKSLTIGNGIQLEPFLRNGVDPERSKSIREELGIPADSVTVGFVGRLVREKGLFELMEAAREVLRRVPNARFLIVGEALQSDEGVREELADLARSTGIEAHFLWTGYRSDVVRLYEAMDVFVLPSYREGMPRSIMEAMASGKPVVASDIPGCRDEVVDGVTGILVPAQDSDALGNAIAHLLEDPETAQKMGLAGRERASRLFDEEEVCKRIVESYKALIKDRIHTRPSALPCDNKRVSMLLKSVLDYGGSALGLLLLSPLFLVVAAAVRLDTPGPVFYRQTREGWRGKPFRIFKFRTMRVGAEKEGLEVSKDDPRITRVGRILRLTSFDELPQLFNILKGEMSLVGPRPLLPGTTRVEEMDRLAMKPGITSYPALFGRHALEWEERMPIDLQYVHQWNIGLDLKILLLTIPIVLSASNVYDPSGKSRLRQTERAYSAGGPDGVR
jgi:lipopolysaccharide/colanic/teichoic acid biosynthesis glycosyltransferase/glycosyltransferase involved in cell wall biosynthesis